MHRMVPMLHPPARVPCLQRARPHPSPPVSVVRCNCQDLPLRRVEWGRGRSHRSSSSVCFACNDTVQCPV
eukprot:1672466-Rhodomonas_salina.2